MKLWVRTGKNGGVGTEYSGVLNYVMDETELKITFNDETIMRFPVKNVFSVTEVPNG